MSLRFFFCPCRRIFTPANFGISMGTFQYNYPHALVHGQLVRRYKRFMADVRLDDGNVVVAHCTNSGSMKSCLEEGAEVWLSPVDNPARKTRFTWEMIRIGEGWVGINTSIPNVLAFEAMKQDAIPGLEGYGEIRREVKFRDSRFDIFAQGKQGSCFVEVKNVTLNEDGVAMFPDAVTTRGQKHLDTLVMVRESGIRAVLLFVIQRTDVDSFAPARHIDPVYAEKLTRAMDHGVEVIPWQVKVQAGSINPLGVLSMQTDQMNDTLH